MCVFLYLLHHGFVNDGVQKKEQRCKAVHFGAVASFSNDLYTRYCTVTFHGAYIRRHQPWILPLLGMCLGLETYQRRLIPIEPCNPNNSDTRRLRSNCPDGVLLLAVDISIPRRRRAEKNIPQAWFVQGGRCYSHTERRKAISMGFSHGIRKMET